MDAGRRLTNTVDSDLHEAPIISNSKKISPDTQTKALSLVKHADPAMYSAMGQTITYTYMIENTGNVTLAGPFSITDDKQGTFVCGSGPMTPGNTTSCTSLHLISNGDMLLASITNIASATDEVITSPQTQSRYIKVHGVVDASDDLGTWLMGQVEVYLWRMCS